MDSLSLTLSLSLSESLSDERGGFTTYSTCTIELSVSTDYRIIRHCEADIELERHTLPKGADVYIPTFLVHKSQTSGHSHTDLTLAGMAMMTSSTFPV